MSIFTFAAPYSLARNEKKKKLEMHKIYSITLYNAWRPKSNFLHMHDFVCLILDYFYKLNILVSRYTKNEKWYD